MQPKVVLVARVKIANRKYDFKPVTLKKGRPVAPENTTTFYLRYSSGGRRIVEPVGSNLDVAFTAFQNRELDHARAKNGLLPIVETAVQRGPERSTETQLGAAIEEYLKDCKAIGNAKDTTDTKQRALYEFSKVCGQQGVTTVEALSEPKTGRRVLLSYLAWMSAHLQKTSVDGARPENTYYSRMRRLGAFLKQQGIKIKKDMNAAPSDPGLLSHHEFPKSKPKKATKYSKEMVRTWLKTATVDEADLIWFFLATGFRDDEAAHAEWSDVNFRDRTINIHAKPKTAARPWSWKPKDDESRSVDIPLSQDVIKRLEARKARYESQRCSLIFPSGACKPNTNLLRIARRAAKRAGITERIGLHTIRKTFACYIAETHSIELVRQLLGHSDIKTTQIYLSADAADVRQMKASVDSMKDAFGG